MRGASYLAGIDLMPRDSRDGKSMIVVDVGGTTTDVGVLLPSGYPRQAAAFIEGMPFHSQESSESLTKYPSKWRECVLSQCTIHIPRRSDSYAPRSFSMPDVQSIGLGGGSRIRYVGTDLKVTIGPDSVGHYVSLNVSFLLVPTRIIGF